MTAEEALANKVRIQLEGNKAWLDNFCIGTYCWATGVGKSKGGLDAIEYIRHEYLQHDIGIPLVLLVTPTEVMRDVEWPSEFEKWNVPAEHIKFICYASLAKEDLTKYDLIIYDECHRLTLPNLRKLEQLKTARLGLTATFPKAKHEDDYERVELLEKLLPPIHVVSTDRAVELGLISDFEITVLKFNLESTVAEIPSGTKSANLCTEAQHYKKLTTQLQYAMMQGAKGVRLKFGMMSKRTQFIYNLPSKERLAKKVLKAIHVENKRTIVFAGSIEQAEKLCGKYVHHSGTDDKYLNAFQSGTTSLLGAVRVLNEGNNLTRPDQCLVVQLDSTERALVQRIGRIVRKRYDQPDFKARIVILVALNTADEKWYKSAIQDFETSRIKEYIYQLKHSTDENVPTE